MKFFLPFFLVGMGGFAGSILRYVTTILFHDFYNIPCGTLVANFIGCFLIGVIAGVSAQTTLLSSQTRIFLATGLCGGFTTLSSFIYELEQLLKKDEYFLALLYLIGTFAGAALAFIVGAAFSKFLFKG